MEIEIQQGILRIKENIQYIEGHFLHYENRHTIEPGSRSRKCQHCGTEIGFSSGLLEKCNVATQQTQESAHQNIIGGEALVRMIENLESEEQRRIILGFLNQCLQHHHH